MLRRSALFVWVGLVAAHGCGSTVVVVDDSCPDGLTACADACVDLLTDAAHCGLCERACDPTTPCVGGECLNACDGGRVECDGLCTDITADPDHCGSCGHSCLPEQRCVSGQCACLDGGFLCGDMCVDLLSDALHCGGCNQACTGAYERCELGVCQLDCDAADLSQCGSECVDTNSDAQHCGDCFEACDEGDICSGGDCLCTPTTCGLCEITDLDATVPQTVAGDTSLSDNNADPPCGDGGAPETVYRFTAATADTYSFFVDSAFFTAMYAYDATSCTLLGCVGYPPVLDLDLAAGQQVLLAVDGYFAGGEGPFELQIDSGPWCPDAALPTLVPQTASGDTTQAGTFHSGSCAGAGPEDSYALTAPVAGPYVIDTVGSSFDTVLYARSATCGGGEIACNDDADGLQSRLLLTLQQDEVVVIFVDAWGASGGAYVLNIRLATAADCPAVQLPSTSPQSVSGDSTVNAPFHAASCGGGGREAIYQFTAPATGSYTFDTAGSNYNTILYVRADDCFGAELGCNDDFNGPQSQLQLSLNAGQTVMLFVDSWGMGGNYTLNISGP